MISADETEVSTYRLYTNGAISVATAFAGPLAGAYLLSRNFRMLGQPVRARRVLWGGVAFTVGFFGVLYALPMRVLDSIPEALFPAFFGAATAGIVEKYQKEAIKAHLDAGGKKGSKLAVAGVAILSMIITLLIAAPLVLKAPPFDGKHVTLEATGAEVYYGGLASEADAVSLGQLLEQREYFSPGGDRSAKIERGADGWYNVVLEIERPFWDQPALARQLDGIIRDVEVAVGAPAQVTARSYTLLEPEVRVFHKLGGE